jgi:RHS repeat-associated protein
MDDAAVSSQLGYNGERREGKTGRYMLGNGYRAFSPVLMRFNSPDSWSPFGDGGVNAYAYCEGDSVNNVDPSGHTIWGELLRVFKATTASKGANRIPQFLVKKSKSSPQTLHTIENKHVYRMQRVVKAYEAKATVASEKAKKAFADKFTGHESYIKFLNDNSIDVVKKFNKAEWKLAGVKKADRYVRRNVGKAGITRPSERKIKAVAFAYDLERAEAAKVKHQQWVSHNIEQFERQPKNVRDPDVKKHFLGDGEA